MEGGDNGEGMMHNVELSEPSMTRSKSATGSSSFNEKALLRKP